METVPPTPGSQPGASDQGAVAASGPGVTINAPFLVSTVAMLCMGLVGNVLVIGAVLVHRRLRVLGNVFVINLAAADLCVTTFVDSFGLVGIATGGRFFDGRHALCELVGVVCVTSCACSMWSIGHISFNRYVRICHPGAYGRLYNRRTVPCLLAATWLVCFHIDLPNLLGWGAHAFDQRIMMCTYDYAASYGYTLFFIGMGFGLPLGVTSFSYLRIAWVVKRAETNLRRVDVLPAVSRGVGTGDGERAPPAAGKPGAPAPAARRPRIGRTDVRLLRSVFTIWIVFLLMWSPYAVTVLGDTQHVWPNNVYVVAVILAHTNSSINGVLYALTNRHFREGYVYLIKRCLGQRKVSRDVIEAGSTVLNQANYPD